MSPLFPGVKAPENWNKGASVVIYVKKEPGTAGPDDAIGGAGVHASAHPCLLSPALLITGERESSIC
jgi:hypothetical protein